MKRSSILAATLLTTMVFSGLLAILLVPTASATQRTLGDDTLYLPVEDSPHEATWLQWPHNYGWDPSHVRRYEPIWLAMVKALAPGEKVRIIAYNRGEKRRIRNLLRSNDIDMAQISIYQYPTDDVWIRDNGPIFVFNQNGDLKVEDWKFNGWVRIHHALECNSKCNMICIHNSHVYLICIPFLDRVTRLNGGLMTTFQKTLLGNCTLRKCKFPWSMKAALSRLMGKER